MISEISASTLHDRDTGQAHAILLEEISAVQYDPDSCQSVGYCIFQASYLRHAHLVYICFHGPENLHK